MPIYAAPDTIRALGGAGLKHCDSRSLWKDKWVFFNSSFDEAKRVALDTFTPSGLSDIQSLQTQWKETKSKQERNRAEGNRVNERELGKATAALEDTALLTNAAPKPISRTRDWLDALPSERATTFTLETTSRLLVGLANGVLENAGCTLHPLFGLPIIPGSALKGIARDAAAVLGKTPDEMHLLFGSLPGDDTNPRQGDVCFLDAHALLRSGQVDLELDVVTPHFQKYYGGTGNPNALDEESPIPSVFPAVCAGVTFEFVLIVPSRRLTNQAAADALKVAKECLIYGLTQLGIGAKTAAGYGRFGTPETTHQSIHQDLFPPPPKPVLSLEEEINTTWKGKAINGFTVGNLIKDLSRLDDAEKLAAVFDQIIPAEYLRNFRAVNPFWTTFLQKGGKTILEKINRPLPRQ